MVMHGGDDGDLKDYGFPDDYIFNWNCKDLQKLDAGNGERIPLLSEVFELIHSTNVFVNIELKGPRTPSLSAIYNCELAANRVLETVNQYDMHGRFLISSFNHDDLLLEMHKARQIYLS